jgi:sugar phosphate permease
MLGSLSLDMFAVLFGGVTAILPMFCEEVLKVGPEFLGVLRAAPAMGATLISFYLMRFPLRHREGRALVLCVLAFGFCILGFGLSRSLITAAAFLLLSGVFDGISMVIRGALVQIRSPESMRGKISAINSMFILSSNEIGAFESGLAANLMGLLPSIYFGGSMTLLVALAVAYRIPDLWKVDLREGSSSSLSDKDP